MNPSTSLLLNTFRSLAALVVLVTHAANFFMPQLFHTLEPLAHDAVILFFVMSGYLIAYTTFRKSRDVSLYTIARLGRLYSVVLPALIIGGILQFAGQTFYAEFYNQFQRGGDFIRYVLAALFLQNVWFFSASPPTNPPFWSLSYEFWYYVIFGVVAFARTHILKVVLGITICLICGPNILLLLPAWLAGVAAYFISENAKLSQREALVVVMVGAISAIIMVAFVPFVPYSVGRPPLFFSGAFLSDWVLACAIAAVLGAFSYLSIEAVPSGVNRCTKFVADHTFSIYLYHYPFVLLLAAALPHKTWLSFFSVVILVTVIAVLLSMATESKRYVWKSG